MRPEEILTLQNACARGLCADTPLELLGDPLESVRVPDFKRARSSDVDFLTRVPKPLRPLAKKIATPLPAHPAEKLRRLRKMRRKLPAAHD